MKNLPAIEETWIRSMGQEDPLHGPLTHEEGEWSHTPVFLPGEFHEQRSLANWATVHGFAKGQTGLSN